MAVRTLLVVLPFVIATFLVSPHASASPVPIPKSPSSTSSSSALHSSPSSHAGRQQQTDPASASTLHSSTAENNAPSAPEKSGDGRFLGTLVDGAVTIAIAEGLLGEDITGTDNSQPETQTGGADDLEDLPDEFQESITEFNLNHRHKTLNLNRRQKTLNLSHRQTTLTKVVKEIKMKPPTLRTMGTLVLVSLLMLPLSLRMARK
ncbi:hypothetical protein BWQ96_09909 [Gracilariopsis chorda]|uniref:Uncharacterized protein n=1 Tax=Gracilariopsis chorda TaxID=448386 RepID=A0A2V3IED7_9FLOR|nr:hypothetical protein BWQ96_09909 [Gracilariopsis chorda]|eukprot:PXF40378.1 hypothetical protein BWQ96_09909 [Gracilariopsis chorda]